jgi:hypothetical protein
MTASCKPKRVPKSESRLIQTENAGKRNGNGKASPSANNGNRLYESLNWRRIPDLDPVPRGVSAAVSMGVQGNLIFLQWHPVERWRIEFSSWQ